MTKAGGIAVEFAVLMVLIFLAGAVGIAAGHSVVTDWLRRDEYLACQRVGNEFRKPSPNGPTARLFKPTPPPLVELDSLPAVGADFEMTPAVPEPRERGWRPLLAAQVEQSGLRLSVRQLLILCAGMGLVLGLLGLFVHGEMVALLGLSIGTLGPMAYVRHKGKARREKLLSQLPTAFDLMARVLRAGQSVPQAFQAVADACEDPIASEFSQCQEQQNLGLLPEITLRDLARRTGVLDVKIFVMAMLIQRQTGGNLSELLERLATLVRERVRIRRSIRTLTAEGRLQAVVLLVLPVVMFFVMRLVNRKYADILLDHSMVLLSMAGLMGMGALWIRKIVNFDI
jgi:tight adherence protein B